MSFWLPALILTALALSWPLAALLRARPAPLPRVAHEAEALKAQIAEIARDQTRGIVSPEDAASARLELSRRLLKADAAAAGTPEAAPRRGAPLVAGLLAAGVLAAAGGVYARIGAPGLPDQPLAGRGPEGAMLAALGAAGGRLSQRQAESLAEARGARPRVPEPPAPPAGEPPLPELYARLRQAVAANAQDPQGLALLAGFGARLGHFEESWPAYLSLADLTADPAEAAALRARAVGAMALAAGGYVSPEADSAMAAALREAPEEASFARGLRLLALEGPEDPRRAREIALGLLEGADFAPAPTAQDVAAAGAMSADDRAAMIEGMVEGLAARLEEEPRNLEGWIRLVGAWGVLGREEERRAALASARAAFAGDATALARLAAADRESAP
ncbi:c-type cytochrome biogenesis protein CcmI [Neomegalonema sp.]|uniref:c-type cytochrome biogenesis protein CcmI n=1 Tax=Neomegalonema sp. TaxID=2039713 RepID=UPI00262D6648|nr:c-type cytochrome biogenesis protein CcmI [Neomegalonema sp.]MDD2868043.1 c-type cytochrome biogenesis protein CcmI [Neomegalonema sp.]